MKHIIIPYIIGRFEKWWGGVDFYNHSENQTVITIKIQRYSNGVIANTITEQIKPWEHYVLTHKLINKNLVEADGGRATILIDCSNDVYITPFMGREDGFSVLSSYEVTNLKK